jgi:hypothetical protein
MQHCNGIKMGTSPGDPHSCIDTQFGRLTAGLVHGAAPDGSRNPQVDLATRYADQGDARFTPLE